jgi:uracil-DNA glycosylase family 4
VSDPRDLLRSYLRQRAELGDDELVLDRHSPGELRTLLGDRGQGTGDRGGAAAVRAAVRPDAPSSAPARGDVPAPRPSPPADAQVHVRAGAQPPGETPMRPARDAPSRGVTAEEIAALPVLNAVRELSLGCPRCRLAETRTRVVFGEGSETAQLMAVGEAPGENEDRQGRPFVGKAGKLLDLLLMSAGFERDAVYICNVLKCRPPGNRNPLPDEVEACSPYLLKQVDLVAPRVVVAFGTFAAQTLLGSDLSIGKLRGKLHQYRGIPVVPTYHPAALLRNPGWVRAVWDDLQRARAVLDGPS